MGETFGEADIILRMRRDELERDIAVAERMTIQSTERIELQRAETLRTISGTANDLGPDMAERIALVGVLTEKTGLLARVIGWVTAAATGSGAAIAGVVAGLSAVTLAAIALGVEVQRSARKAAEGISEARRNLDGTTERTRELAEALDRIPLAGGAIGTAFRLASGDVVLVDEQLTSMIATVEDGEVKVGLLARTFGNLAVAAQKMKMPGAPSISDIRGGTDDPIGDIDDSNAAARRDALLRAVRDRMNAGMAGLGDQSADRAREAQRAAMAEGLEGVEAIRAAERARFEDAARFNEDERRKAQAVASAALASIQKQQDDDNISAMDARLSRLQVQASLDSAIVGFARDRADEEQAIAEQAERQVAAFHEQQAEQARLTAAANERLASLTKENELRAEGRDFAADIEGIERQRREALSRAGDTGEDIGLIEDYYDTLAALVQRGEQDRLDREQEFADRRLANQQRAADLAADIARREAEREQAEFNARGDQLNRVRSRILEQRLRLEGRDREADEERIRQSFEEQILGAIDDNNPELERALMQLRDLQIAGLDVEGQQTRARDFQQVSASRFSAGVGGDDRDDRKMDEQTRVLKDIRSELKDDRVAVAG